MDGRSELVSKILNFKDIELEVYILTTVPQTPIVGYKYNRQLDQTWNRREPDACKGGQRYFK